jgi:hypothetical protein
MEHLIAGNRDIGKMRNFLEIHCSILLLFTLFKVTIQKLMLMPLIMMRGIIGFLLTLLMHLINIYLEIDYKCP